MEINISKFMRNDPNPAMYSGSIAEQGENVAWRTHANALQLAAYGTNPLLDTPDKLAAMRRWAIETGAWSAKEVSNWSAVELNALFIQLVSGDIREKGDSTWEEYQEESEYGQVSGALFQGIDGEIYYSLEG